MENLRFRHRRKGYIVTVVAHPDSYEIRDYRVHQAALSNIYLEVGDFEELFEHAPEYCCEWFRRCVENEVFRKDTVQDHQWVWDDLDEWFTECPFCKTKL